VAAQLPFTRRRDLPDSGPGVFGPGVSGPGASGGASGPGGPGGPEDPGAAIRGRGEARLAMPGIDAAPLLGTWVSFAAATGGLARVVVASRDGQLRVRAFGGFPAAPRDWGEVAGAAFAEGVDAAAAVGFLATYRFGFLDAMVAAYLNKRLLVVDTYNVFRDGSGRSPYFARDHFYHPAESAAAAGAGPR
jgi:hypothetical protein